MDTSNILYKQPPMGVLPPMGAPEAVAQVDVDELGYFHLNLDSMSARREYSTTLFEISREVENNQNKMNIPFEQLKPSMQVIVKRPVPRGCAEFFVRATIEKLSLTEKKISVWETDRPHQIFEVDVSTSNNHVFHPSASILAQTMPLHRIKCELQELEILTGLSFIQTAVKQMDIKNRLFTATLICKEFVPLIKLETKDTKEDLTELILKQIQKVCAFPKFDENNFRNGKLLPITVSHIEDNGYIWCQEPKSELLERISSFSDGFDITDLVKSFPKYKKDVLLNLHNPETVFAAPFDGQYYRAKVLEVQETTALVLFIDYGNKESVLIEDLFMLENVGKIYKFIPPQVKKLKLHQMSDIDTDDAWNHLAKSEYHKIILKKPLNGDVEAEVDLKIMLPDGSAPSLSKLMLV